MEYVYESGNNNYPTLILLHGTGGDEYDLIPIAKTVLPDAPILSLRGDVNEGGLNRFFRRIAPGVFDEEDVALRAKNLKDWLIEKAKHYDFSLEKAIAIGYSNGANIIAALLNDYGNILHHAALLHPMTPYKDKACQNLAGVNVFIAAGINDTIAPKQETVMLKERFEGANAALSLQWSDGGHQLTHETVDALKTWIKNHQ